MLDLLGSSCPITSEWNHRIITRDFPKMQKKSAPCAAALYRNAPCTQSKRKSSGCFSQTLGRLHRAFGGTMSPLLSRPRARSGHLRLSKASCRSLWLQVKGSPPPPRPVNAPLQSAAGASVKLSVIDTGRDGKGSSK